MHWPQVFVFLGVIILVGSQNSTDDLEVRVTLLENDVMNLQDDVEEVETDGNLQDEQLINVEEIVNGNSSDIDDLVASVDTLQEEMAILRVTNTLLLQRLSDLETVLNATSQTVEDHDVDIQDTNIRLSGVEDDLIIQQTQITTLEQRDTEHDERISILEDDVDTWDDRIIALETADQDIQNRLVTLEEMILTPWVACDSSPCVNGGSCIDVNVDTFVCACRDGYYGQTCQNSPFEACSSSLCENDATCVDVNVDTYICLCRDGFFGLTCDESYADTPFLASFDYHPGTPGDPIVFNVAPLNVGGHYDVTTGIYTVPIDGVYEFMYHIWVRPDPIFDVFLEVDNVRIFHGVSLEGTYDEPNLHVTALLSLTAGQQVWLSPANLSGMRGFDGVDYESWFAGHLVHAL